jgi:murein DD-endopeptidase MepM/ murein hydrolase activator NlpD
MTPSPHRSGRLRATAFWAAAAVLSWFSTASAAIPRVPERVGSLEDIPVVDHFVSPVGDPHDYAVPARGESRGYLVTRGVQRRGNRHLGLDLSNRVSGGEVRAPGDGVVLEARRYGGWGNLVVIAHRLPGGDIVLSVLAHLKPRSIAVKPGDRVVAGERLGKVGQSGHASGPHLHFELRSLGRSGDPWLAQWEKAPVLDPLKTMGATLAEVLLPSPEENRIATDHWSAPYLSAALARTASPSLGDPNASLSRLEFYGWLERAIGIEPASASWSKVRKKMSRQGLLDLPKSTRDGSAPVTAEEASRSLSALLALDRLPGVPASSRVSRHLLQSRGLPVPAPTLVSGGERILGPSRPLTRGEGALLLASARSWPQAPLAAR